MTPPARSPHRQHWSLDPERTVLNHGSFGACPSAVLDEQSRLRAQMESNPTEFFFASSPDLWSEALTTLADFLQADPRGLTFQPNATTGLATILTNLQLQPGDQFLLADHAYGACKNAIDKVCTESGATPVTVSIPMDTSDPGQIIELFEAATTLHTRYVLVDAVTSPTASRMPFEDIVRRFQDRGIDAIVDAAHGPGLLPLNLNTLGAAYVIGNCHKWLCTPKGSGFLHVREDKRKGMSPLITSHGYSSRAPGHDTFREEFDWPGTQDPTPWLCIPKAIETIENLIPGGWPEVMQHNRDLALHVRSGLADMYGDHNVTPAANTTAMVTARLAPLVDGSASLFDTDPLMQSLLDNYGIQIIVFPWVAHNARYLRISTPLYCSISELDYTLSALAREGLAS